MRSPANKYNDKILDFIITEYKKLFEKEITPGQAMKMWTQADKRVGLAIVCLRRIRAYEKRSGDTVRSITPFYETSIKRNRMWPDAEQDEAKRIDREYEKQTQEFNQVGNVLKRLGDK